jgi:rSAM/selenodomain-associated transferase 2
MTTCVSVVVPVLNEAVCLGDLLEDLAPLRRAGHEVIVVDGGSSDGTPGVARGGADRVLAAAKGRARQMNAGAAAARGDWLWFLHADCRVPPAALTALLAASARGSGWGRFDVRLSGETALLRVVERLMNWRSGLTGIATGDQGILVARSAFLAVGRYPDIPLMEDIALSRRLARRQRPLRLRPPLRVSSRRWEQHGVLRTILLMWRLRLAYALGVSPQRLVKSYYA